MSKNDTSKVIICLAASRKPGGRCIAGKDVSDGSWVRPVSEGEEDAINNQQSRYQDGQPAQLLDIIEIPVAAHKPKQHQTENFLVDNQKKWLKKGVFDSGDLKKLLDKPPSLWQGWSSTKYGNNDRIYESEIEKIGNSLFFIQTQCTIIVNTETRDNEHQKKVRCSFNYNKTNFILPVTDTVIEQEYLRKIEGEYDIKQKYICVSLGPVYYEYLYLFAAAII